jgi:adenylate cyclase
VSENVAGHVTRRRASILFAGYNLSRPNDDADSFSRLSRLRTETIEPQILAFSGHLLRWTGDGVFVEFESVIEAVRCAIGLRDILAQ